MDKEKEIEEMAKELHCATNESFISCRKIARILVERCGYGNVERYQEEVEKYKGLYVSCYRKMADYHEQVLVEQNTVGKLEDDIKLLKINQEKEKQQAVKEFAEKLKAELWKFDGSWQEYDGEELCETVDKLITELYGN